MKTSSELRSRKKEKVLAAQRQFGAVPKKSTLVIISMFALIFMILAITSLLNIAGK